MQMIMQRCGMSAFPSLSLISAPSILVQVIMQRCGVSWVPDVVFTETSFQPLQGGPGCNIHAKALQKLLTSPAGSAPAGLPNTNLPPAAGGDPAAAADRIKDFISLLLMWCVT